MSSNPICCRSTSLLRLSHRSPFYLRLLRRPACSLHVTRCVSSQSCRPLRNYQPSASTVVLPPGKHSRENQSHQQLRSTEKMNVAVLNQPKMQRKISLPLQRERGREKSGRSLNRLERCPNNWKLVIGLYFTLPPEK